MTHDSDGFNRWNCAQQLSVEVMSELLLDYQAGRAMVLDQRVISAFDAILQLSIDKSRQNLSQDKEMVAQLLTLPSEAYLSELADEVDVAGIHTVREFVSNAIANTLAAKWAILFEINCAAQAYRADAQGIAQRALKNTCLGYLLRTDNAHYLQVCKEQFDSADNMTDVAAALRLLVNSSQAEAEPLREEALRSFYEKWQHEALVVDLWFAIQAVSILLAPWTECKFDAQEASR